MFDKSHTSSESAVQAGSSTTITIEQLGKEIVARIEAGDRAKTMADDRYRSAGLLLIEVRQRVPVKSLAAFLKDHCAGLSLTRAKELIAIAEGRTTQEEVRAKATARKQKSRANAAAATGRDGHGQSEATSKPTTSTSKPTTSTSKPTTSTSGDTKQPAKGSQQWWFNEAVYFDHHTMALMDDLTFARVMKMFNDKRAERRQRKAAA